MEIPWDGVHVRGVYEDMIAVLIKRLHPAAQHINGRGGDGGRDVQVPTDGGLIIYELKSFTGPLRDGGRKDQVARSLASAAEHEPTGWRLVVPRNHTPAELNWFEKLTAGYDFPCEWFGRNWLNSELAGRPDITRYFLEDHRDEFYKLIQDLGLERSDFQDIPGGLLRLSSIQRRLNDINPFYDFVLGHVSDGRTTNSVHGKVFGTQRIDVVPKYATALNDQPITIDTEFQFTQATAHLREALERSLDYGDPVELPPEVVSRFKVNAPEGLETEFKNIAVSLAGVESSLPEQSLVHVSISESEGSRPLSTLEFRLTRRHGGRAGVTVLGRDPSGLVSLRLRVPRDGALQIDLTYVPRPVLPEAARPTAEWLEHMVPGNVLTVDFVEPRAGTATAAICHRLLQPGLSDYFSAFAELQRHAGISFEVPDDVTNEEWQAVAQVAEWLRPEKRKFRWNAFSFTMYGDASDKLCDSLTGTSRGALVTTQSAELEFRGRRLDLGDLARSIGPVSISSADEVNDARRRGQPEIVVSLEPQADNVGYEWLLTHEEARQLRSRSA